MATNVWLWTVAGAVPGILLQGPFGLAIGGIAGFLLGRARLLEDRLTALQKHLDATSTELTTRISGLEAQLQETPVSRSEHSETQDIPPEAITSTPADEPALPADTSIPAFPESVQAVAEDTESEWLAPPLSPTKKSGPDIGQRILAWFTGGNPVVRIGIVILFFGISFLVKYAADRNVLPIELRLAGIALAAVAVLIVGWRLRERPGAYGLVLQGGAVAVLYLTVFGAIKLYQLLPGGLAFVLMVALVSLSGALAVLQNARSLALFGAAGGFITPILLSSGGGSHVMLFSYYALLNAGILGIAWFKSWRILNVLGFVFTFVIGAAWGHSSYRPEYFSTTEPFLILFFLFYVTIAVLFAHRQPPQLKGYIDGSLVFGVPLVGFTLQSALVHKMEWGLAYSALFLSTFYILLARALWKRQVEGMRLLTEAFLALGVVFGSLAVPLALDGHWTATTWALEGAALVWVGIHQQRRLARWFGLLLQIGAGAAFMISIDAGKAPLAVWNGAYLGSLMVCLAGLFSSWQLQRHKPVLIKFEHELALPVLAWGLIWWFGSGVREIDLFMANRTEAQAILVFVSLSALLAGWLARRIDWPTIGMVTVALLPVQILTALHLFAAASHTHPGQYWGWLAWPVALASQIRIMRSATGFWINGLTSIWHSGGFLLLVFLTTWQLSWAVDQFADGSHAWPLLVWGLVPALCLLMMMKYGRRLPWPVRDFPDAYLGSGLLPLTAYLALWTLYGCIQNGDPAPLPYLPIANPLDLVQLLSIYTLIRWWMKPGDTKESLESTLGSTLPAAIALVAFAWLNALVARTVHFWADVPFTWSALHHSMVYQASVSVLWSTTALAVMVYASRQTQRMIWFSGCGILVLVVAKLFLVDLSSSGTIARIVSFLAVGGLMLVIGYFSPLPPRPAAEQET